VKETHPETYGDLIENLVFVKSFIWFPFTLMVMLALFICLALWRLGRERRFLSQPVKNNPAVL